MAKRLFVGNLPYDLTDNEIERIFAEVGQVASVSLVTDRYSGQSKGFAFVEMMTEESAQEAIQKLNGYSIQNRALVVNEARPREERSGGGGGYGGGRGGGGDQGRSFDRRRGGGGNRGGGGGFSRDKRW